MQRAWNEGGWAIYIDEAYYIEHELGLGRNLTKLLTQGRSKRLTIILGVQRPAWISRFALSEPTHILASRFGDRRDIKTMREISGEKYADSLAELERYEFAYINKISGSITNGVTRANVRDRLSA